MSGREFIPDESVLERGGMIYPNFQVERRVRMKTGSITAEKMRQMTVKNDGD